MRREELYLADILEAAEAIATFLAGRDEAQFGSDDMLRSAVLHKLMIIGEAVARLPDELKTRHPEVPWGRVVGFRNVVVHVYFGLDWAIVWDTATLRVPELKQTVAEILQAEFPGHA